MDPNVFCVLPPKILPLLAVLEPNIDPVVEGVPNALEPSPKAGFCSAALPKGFGGVCPKVGLPPKMLPPDTGELPPTFKSPKPREPAEFAAEAKLNDELSPEEPKTLPEELTAPKVPPPEPKTLLEVVGAPKIEPVLVPNGAD